MYFMIIEYTICSFWNSSSHIHITIVIYAKNGALIIYYCIVAIFFFIFISLSSPGKMISPSKQKKCPKSLDPSDIKIFNLNYSTRNVYVFAVLLLLLLVPVSRYMLLELGQKYFFLCSQHFQLQKSLLAPSKNVYKMFFIMSDDSLLVHTIVNKTVYIYIQNTLN